MKRILIWACSALWVVLSGASEPPRVLDDETKAMMSRKGMREACERYEAAFRRPEVRERLEEWYRQVPQRLDPKTLEQVPARYPNPGYVHTFPLGFDPAEIGLNPDARVEADVGEDGTIYALSISDTLRVAYFFKTDRQSEDYFRNSPAMRHPQSENVSVYCLLR
jgi:hypothetical protein